MNNYRHTHRHLYHQTGDRCWWEDCQDHHHHRHSEKRRFDRKSAKKWRRRNANLASMLRLFPLNLFCTDFLDFGIGILVIQAGLVTHSLHWAISMHLEVTEFHQVLCFDVKTIFCFVNKGLDTRRKKNVSKGRLFVQIPFEADVLLRWVTSCLGQARSLICMGSSRRLDLAFCFFYFWQKSVFALIFV